MNFRRGWQDPPRTPAASMRTRRRRSSASAPRSGSRKSKALVFMAIVLDKVERRSYHRVTLNVCQVFVQDKMIRENANITYSIAAVERDTGLSKDTLRVGAALWIPHARARRERRTALSRRSARALALDQAPARPGSQAGRADEVRGSGTRGAARKQRNRPQASTIRTSSPAATKSSAICAPIAAALCAVRWGRPS